MKTLKKLLILIAVAMVVAGCANGVCKDSLMCADSMQVGKK